MALVYLLRSVDRTKDLRPRPSGMEVFSLNREPKHMSNIRKLAGVVR
jgi:hypothetical protein